VTSFNGGEMFLKKGNEHKSTPGKFLT
jgi:hypothetical protein